MQFNPRYFRNVVMKKHLLEGVHYVRAFDGRKLLIIWERVEEELLGAGGTGNTPVIPMARGGRCHV
nr:hypothetical protein [Ectothiorhodospira variabilis]